MGTRTSYMAAHFGSAVLWGALCMGTLGCGEDKTESADAGTTGKNKCIAPGIGGMCMCGPGRNGTNTCGEDGYWTSCLCVSLPDGALCHEGEALICTNTCPGESKPRMTRCLNGKYDCTCPDAGTIVKLDAGM